VSRQAIELTEEKTPCYKRRSRLASNSDGEVDWPGGECKTINDSGACLRYATYLSPQSTPACQDAWVPQPHE